MPSDHELLRAYIDFGQQDAFQEIVRRHLPLVYRSALRQLNADCHRAEDVAQMVFITLTQRARHLSADVTLPTWLYATTQNVTRTVIRTEMRRRKREAAWATDPTTRADSEPTVAWESVAPILDESVRTLAARDRDALVLRFFGNRSFAEIGAALRIREDAARMRVNRALDKLRARFAARGITLSATALAGLLAADTALGAPTTLAPTVAAAALSAPTASAFVGVASFMTASKMAGTAAIAAALLAIGVATSQSIEARIAQSNLADAQAEVTALRSRIARQQAQSAKSASVREAEPPGFDRSKFMEIFDAGDAFLAAHPEAGEALIASQRAKIRGKYLPLYLELKLTPAQVAEFEAAMLGASGKSLPNGSSVYVGEHLTPYERNDRLRSILGDDGYQRFQASRRAGANSAQTIIEQLATRLACTDEPLSLETSAVLRDIVEEARVTTDSGDYWPAALPRLEAVLSKTQMNEVRAIRSLDRYWRAQADVRATKASE